MQFVKRETHDAGPDGAPGAPRPDESFDWNPDTRDWPDRTLKKFLDLRELIYEGDLVGPAKPPPGMSRRDGPGLAFPPGRPPKSLSVSWHFRVYVVCRSEGGIKVIGLLEFGFRIWTDANGVATLVWPAPGDPDFPKLTKICCNPDDTFQTFIDQWHYHPHTGAQTDAELDAIQDLVRRAAENREDFIPILPKKEKKSRDTSHKLLRSRPIEFELDTTVSVPFFSVHADGFVVLAPFAGAIRALDKKGAVELGLGHTPIIEPLRYDFPIAFFDDGDDDNGDGNGDDGNTPAPGTGTPPTETPPEPGCGATAIEHRLSEVLPITGQLQRIADLVQAGRIRGNPHVLDFVFALFLNIKLTGTNLDKCTIFQEVKVYIREFKQGAWRTLDDNRFAPDTGISPNGEVPVGADGLAVVTDRSILLVDAYSFGDIRQTNPFIGMAEIRTTVRGVPNVETTTFVFFASKGVKPADGAIPAGANKDQVRTALRARVLGGGRDADRPAESAQILNAR